jgi:hypothetical protein
MKLLGKLKKDAKVGFSSALHVVGLKKDEEDPDFLARDQTIKGLSAAISALLPQFQALGAALHKVATPSDTIHARLVSGDYSSLALVPLTVSLTNDQLQVNCVHPLESFQARLATLDRVRKKRGRNRVLAASASGDEQRRRREKYERFHTAFLRGADLLTAKWPALLAQVFGAEFHYLVQYGVTVKRLAASAAAHQWPAPELIPALDETFPLYPPPPDDDTAP